MTQVSLFDQLNAPFPFDAYAANYQGYASVNPQSTSDRLNEVFTPMGWRLEAIESQVDMKLFSVSILAMISIRDEKGEWIGKTQFGDATMVIEKNTEIPKSQAVMDAKKKAMSDAMKKCASLLGVASDVYQSRIRVVKAKGDNRYFPLLQKLNLHSARFPNGVCILPDDYKAYYEEKGWSGVFESDLASLKDNKGKGGGNKTTTNPESPSKTVEKEKVIDPNAALKEKYKKGQGNLDGFDEWFKKMQEKGMRFSQMDYVLQDAINKKTEKAKQDAHSQKSKADEKKTVTAALSGETEYKKGPNTDNAVFELSDLEALGDVKSPYLKMVFKHKGIPTEVFACGSEMIEEVEKLNLTEGSRCHILTREAKGKNVLRQIRKAS
jgi:hypothetical protein